MFGSGTSTELFLEAKVRKTWFWWGWSHGAVSEGAALCWFWHGFKALAERERDFFCFRDQGKCFTGSETLALFARAMSRKLPILRPYGWVSNAD